MCFQKVKKLGGAPANFAYHVSQFGLNSCAVSAMGDDELGKELEKELNDHHLNYQIDKVAYPTGTVQVSLDANGIPCYDIKEGAAWDNIPYTPALEELAKNCTAACFGSLAQRNEVSRNTIYRFLDNMPEGRRNPQNLRYQSPSGILYQGDYHREHQAMQHPQDQR